MAILAGSLPELKRQLLARGFPVTDLIPGDNGKLYALLTDGTTIGVGWWIFPTPQDWVKAVTPLVLTVAAIGALAYIVKGLLTRK